MSTKASDRRITVIVALATFLSLTAISAAVWALSRPDVPAPAPAPAAMPVAQASALPADHDHDFERITVEELKPLADKGEVILIDVRSAAQFLAGHIPDALHIPVASIEGEIPHLPKGKLIVTYCTCPNEESSGEAALILQHNGVGAKALKGGLEAWTAPGYPTATGVK